MKSIAEKIATIREYREAMKNPKIDAQAREQFRSRAITLQIEVDEDRKELEDKFTEEESYDEGQTALGDSRLGEDKEIPDYQDDDIEIDQPNSPFSNPIFLDKDVEDDEYGVGGSLDDYDDCSHDL